MNTYAVRIVVTVRIDAETTEIARGLAMILPVTILQDVGVELESKYVESVHLLETNY